MSYKAAASNQSNSKGSSPPTGTETLDLYKYVAVPPELEIPFWDRLDRPFSQFERVVDDPSSQWMLDAYCH